MFSEIFRFCSLSLLSGLFLVFASVNLFCSIWILLLEIFLSAVLVSRVSVAQTAPAPINLVTWECSCPWREALVLGILPSLDHCSQCTTVGVPLFLGPSDKPSCLPFASLCTNAETMWVSQLFSLPPSDQQKVWGEALSFLVFIGFSVLLWQSLYLPFLFL